MKGAPQNDREAHSTIVRTGSAGLMAKALPLKVCSIRGRGWFMTLCQVGGNHRRKPASTAGHGQPVHEWLLTHINDVASCSQGLLAVFLRLGRKTPFAPSLSVTILSSEVSQISTFPKFMEELIMPFKRAQVPSQREILSLAEDWGKVVARRAFGDEGPDLDLNFDAIEAVAFQAAQAVIKGTIQQSLSQQMRKLGETQPCPQCRRVCPVETEPRELVVRGATVQYDEPKCHCPTCRRDFFPSPSRVAT